MLSYSIRLSPADARRDPASITNGTSCSSESSLPVRTRNNPSFARLHFHYAALPKTHESLELSKARTWRECRSCFGVDGTRLVVSGRAGDCSITRSTKLG